MILFLYGPDSFRSKQKLDEIIVHYKSAGKSGLNLMHLDASEIEFSNFYDRFKISSMFAEKKLVILKNVFASKKFQEDFLENLKTIEEFKDVVVVYEGEEPDQRLKLFKALLKECKSQEFSLLDGKNLKVWAAKEFQNLSQKINVDALDLLLNFTSNDLWRLDNEIKKLSNFKKDGVVKKEDVEALVKPNITTDIFKTIDALAAKNKRQALALLQKHLDAGDNALYLLSMMAYQFRNLLIVKQLAEKGMMYASIVKKSGLHPFVVKKNYYQCHQFSFGELKHIYQKIFRLDSDVKVGKLEAEAALELLVAAI